MKAGASITRRIMISVLALEGLAAVVLIATVTTHERRVRFEAFDANLRAASNALLGAVQESETNDDSVRLDLRGLRISPRAVFMVTADGGNVLGAQGKMSSGAMETGTFTEISVKGVPFRFYALEGQRAIDPGSPRAVNHTVTVIYGLPEGHLWHEIMEATRFFALATVVLLGLTALLMSWLIRRYLVPIGELAAEAEKIDPAHAKFEAPASSMRFLELRPLASAIEKTVERLRRSFEQQRQFTNDAAHELKTDLAIVKSSVQVLAMRQRTIEEYELGLAVGLEDIARLENTVQRMLTLARLEQGPREERQSCDLAEVLAASVAQSQPYAELQHVNVVSDHPERGVIVPLSREDALLLCSNVLMNALQHSRAGSLVHVTMSVEGGEAVLRIRDEGEGIAEADLPFLFDAFYRGDASRSRKSGGTGLGLSICRAICVRAAGSIRIGNHAEGGAEVVIELPVVEVLEAAPVRATLQ